VQHRVQDPRWTASGRRTSAALRGDDAERVVEYLRRASTSSEASTSPGVASPPPPAVPVVRRLREILGHAAGTLPRLGKKFSCSRAAISRRRRAGVAISCGPIEAIYCCSFPMVTSADSAQEKVSSNPRNLEVRRPRTGGGRARARALVVVNLYVFVWTSRPRERDQREADRATPAAALLRARSRAGARRARFRAARRHDRSTRL